MNDKKNIKIRTLSVVAIIFCMTFASLHNNAYIINQHEINTVNHSISSEQDNSFKTSSNEGLIRGFDEILVNNYTIGTQESPSICSISSNRFVVAWQSKGQDGSGWGIYASVFNAITDENLTSEFRINEYTTSNQENPSICALSNDRFAVAWQSYGQDGSGWGIYTKVFNVSTGQSLTSEIRINDYTTSNQANPSICALSNDRFAVAWQSYGQDGSYYGVYARVFNATTGENITSEIRINEYTTYNQENPSICALSNDRFAVAWQSNGQDGSIPFLSTNYGVYTRVFNAFTGQSLISEIRVNEYTTNNQENPSICTLSTDTFAVAWQTSTQDGSGCGIYARIFNASTGQSLTSEVRVNHYIVNHQSMPSICVLSSSVYAVAWQSNGQDGSYYGVYARLFNASTGQSLTSEVLVNEYFTSNQESPSICALSNDRFTVAWQSNGQDGSYYGVYARVFNANTVQNISSEYYINEYTTNNQMNPSVCALSSEKIAVAWQSNGQDGSGYGVYAMVFNAITGQSLTTELRVNEYTTSNQESPSICALSSDRFAVVWQSYGQDGSGWGIYARVFNANTGENLTSEFRVNHYIVSHQSMPSICALSSDRIAVAWQSNGQDGSGYGVYTRVFDAITGQSLTSEFYVNDHFSSNQMNPSICALSTDRFAVAWQSNGQDGSYYGIYARVFNAFTGQSLTSEVLVNEYTTSNQECPSICTLSTDRFAVSWQSYGQDGSGWGVYARVFNAITGQSITSEFRVNHYTVSHQSMPSISALSNDRIAIAWQSNAQDGSYYGVYARLFNASTGQSLTSEFFVNEYFASNQENPSICTLSSEKFTIAWQSNGQDGSGYGVYAKLFNAFTGQSLTSEFCLSEYTTKNQMNPSVCTLSSDKFAVAWQSYGEDGSGYGIYARVFDAITGQSLTSEFRINEYITSDQINPSICALSNNTFAVAWQSNGQDGSGWGIYTRVFDAITGQSITSEVRVNHYIVNHQSMPSICALSSSVYAVAWQSNGQDGSGYGIYARVFDASTGQSLTSEFFVNEYFVSNQMNPSICALSSDRFAVAWQSYGQDGSGYGIYARVFNAFTGQNTTSEVRVNEYTTSNQENPSICALSSDRFAVAWQSNGQDGSGYGVYARVFNAITGQSITSEFRVNEYTTSNQENPSICALSSDRIAVAWQSNGQDGSYYGVYARVFNTITGQSLTSEFLVNHYTVSHQSIPSICAFSNERIAVAWHSNGQDGSGYGVYATVFNITLTDDNYEENDMLSEAYDLSSYQTIWISSFDGFGIQLDEDWYEIYAPSGEDRLIVDLRFIHADGNIDLEIFNSSGAIITGSYSDTDNEYIDYILPSNGTYYIRIYGDNNITEYDLYWDTVFL